MTTSKGWNWNIVKGNYADFWRTPSIESFYLVQRWQNLGFKDFLDLGCGLGRHAILFGQNGFAVSCFDISDEAIKQTKNWAESENLTFDYQVGDMLKLPYSDNSFNAILCRNVISHTDTSGIKQIINELYRVLRPGGECYLTLGSKDTWGWKATDWPLVDENTKLRQEDGPEDGIPHFYADYNLIKALFNRFEILNLYQIEEFHENPTEHQTYEEWHYHVLIRKPQLLNFVPTEDPILRQKCRELSPEEIRSAKIQRLIDDLFSTVNNADRGVGLSANQVGHQEAISVIAAKPTPARPHLKPFHKVYINTKIIKTFGKKQLMWEGCLSTATDQNGEPSMAQVPRFPKIQVEYLDRNGQMVREVIDGFVAHVLQHETDHLNGILFTDLIDKTALVSYQEYIKLSKSSPS